VDVGQDGSGSHAAADDSEPSIRDGHVVSGFRELKVDALGGELCLVEALGGDAQPPALGVQLIPEAGCLRLLVIGRCGSDGLREQQRCDNNGPNQRSQGLVASSAQRPGGYFRAGLQAPRCTWPAREFDPKTTMRHLGTQSDPTTPIR